MPDRPPYALTKYPDIYRNTYWGAGDTGPDSPVITNRNWLAEEYEITALRAYRSIRALKRWMIPGALDHTETYACRGGRVLWVWSVYDDAPQWPGFGATQIRPVYRANAVSWARTFPSPRAMRAECTAWMRDLRKEHEIRTRLYHERELAQHIARSLR